MPDLIVDSRETNSGIPALLRSAGVPFLQQELAAGDYQIGDVLLERKSANDLAASILDGRLFPQAEALSSAAPRPMLLIEGDIRAIASRMHEDALPGAISALALYWNVNILWAPDAPSVVRLLERMWRHTNEGLGYEVPLRTKKPPAKADGAVAQYLVEGLPGVGPETARRLVQHFGTARAVFSATPQQLRACQGVGPKTAESIAGALDLQPTGFRVTKRPPSSAA